MVHIPDEAIEQLFTILAELNLGFDSSKYKDLNEKEQKELKKSEVTVNEIVLKALKNLEKKHPKYFSDSTSRLTNQIMEEESENLMVNALQFAVLQPNAYAETIAQVIKMGTSEDCMRVEENNRTALHLVFSANNQVLIPTIIDSLKEKLKSEGKNPAEIKKIIIEFVNIEMNDKLLESRFNNATVLSLACGKQKHKDNRSVDQFNCTEVKYLLENGANPNFKDHKGNTPLHHSISTGKLIAQLIKEDESLYAIEGTRPLLPLLVKAGAKIEEKNLENKTFYADLRFEHQEEVKEINKMVKLAKSAELSTSNLNDNNHVARYQTSKSKSKGCSIM